jgi:S-layer protein
MAVQITTAMQNMIAQNYLAILGRNPDPSGFSYWVQTLADNNNTVAAQTAIVNGFGNSSEFRSVYASLNTTQAVTLLYNNVLLRAPDSGGLTYWSNYANNLIASGQTLTNAYAQTASQIIYTASANGSGDSASVNSRTTAAVASGQATPTTTYTLTTNIDTITGSSNMIVSAADNAAAATWTGLDSIIGTGTNNTFNVATSLALAGAPAGAVVTGIQTMTVAQGGNVASTLNTTGFTGLTQLTATTVAGTGSATSLTAAATTNVNLTGSTANTTAGALTVLGGNNVTVTGVGSAIVVGGTSTTSPVGTVSVTDTTQAATNVAIDGGNGVTVRTTGQTSGTVIVGATVAAAGAVSVTVGGLTTAATTGVVRVTGGSTITISDVVANTTTTGTAVTGTIQATGGTTTTAISVTQAATVAVAIAIGNVANTSNVVAAVGGVTAGVVTIADKNPGSTTVANTLAAVTLANYGASTITSTALNTLTLSGTGSTLSITEGGSTAQIAANKTLALNLGGGSLGVITDVSDQFTLANVTLSANTTLAGTTGTVGTTLKTLALSGTGVLTLTSANAALTSITLAGAAGLNSDISGTAITALTAAGTTGAVTATLNAGTQTFTGGTGRDIITIGANATKVITGGSGTTDRLVLSNTAATYLAATNTNVTGFEQLFVTNVGGGTYNMSSFTGFNVVGVNVAASTNTFTNVAAGTSLNLESATTAVVYQAALGTTSVVVNLVGTAVTAANGGGTAGFATTALTLNDINNVGLGTVTINSDASVFQGLHTIATLTDGALSNLAITGTGSLGIGLAATTATTLTISDNGTGTSATADGFTTSLTSTGDVLGAINYSGTHAFTTALLVDNVANLAITNANTGTTGVFTVGGHTNTLLTAASLTLTGSVAYTGVYLSTSAMTVSGATDNSVVNLTLAGATGAKTVTLGNGADVVVTGAANDVITVGTGGNTITGAAGGDLITLGAGTASSAIVQSAAAQTILGSVTSGTTALTLAAGADRVVGLQAGDTINLTALTVNLYTAGALGTTLNGATGGIIEIVRGNWASATGIFTTSSTGTDSVLQFNNLGTGGADATTQETIVLVGFVNSASTTTIDGLITLA